ncbi:14467_t:CDS:2, partial [Gigaspora margarita]
PYISTACYPCKLAKVKCSGGIPCDRCSKRIYNFDERNKIFDESLMICSLC